MNTLNEFFKDASQLNKMLDDSKEKVETFNMREGRLGQPKSEYNDFDELCTNFQPFFSLISTAYESKKGLADYSSQPLLQATFSFTEADTSVKQW